MSKFTVPPASPFDPFFPSRFFAKVPAEALSALAHHGRSKMTHGEFRVFVALCRFRGPSRIVNAERETLERMIGTSPNNISRATHGLQRKGWLVIHYVDPSTRRKIANYELKVPERGARVFVDEKNVVPQDVPVHLAAPKAVALCGKEDEALWCDAYDEPEVNCMTAEELERLLGADAE